MFRAKTVLILGAGASCEVGLPDGGTLLDRIIQLLTYYFDHGSEPREGDRIIFYALKNRLNEGHEVVKLNQHLKAAAQIVKSAAQAISIDNVIDMLEDEKAEAMGKLGISRAILDAERSSAYFIGSPERPSDLIIGNFKPTWYSSLTKVLTEGIRRSTVETVFQNLSIINFNYDRCLERYLSFSISDYFGIPEPDAQKLVDGLPIHRPYGRVGRLPWQRGSDAAIQFGQNSPPNVGAAALQLRTFTEQVEEEEALKSIQSTIADAERLVFLGFAFHRQNIKLLSGCRSEMPEVLATAYGVSNSDQASITTDLSEAFGVGALEDQNSVELFNTTCSGLFDECWRTLTAPAQQ